MTAGSREAHWQHVYTGKGETGVSWFEATPDVSLGILKDIGATPASALIDVGGGASRLVDALLRANWASITVLDLSDAALNLAKGRLGEASERVQWIMADVTRWQPSRTYDVWHDRAAFHFLTSPQDRAAYVDRMTRALEPGAHAIIGTFAPDGPERCSGLPVIRYDAEALAHAAGPSFRLAGTREHIHVTPSGVVQPFQFSVLRRC
jgi:ubiquinone/menaquinone biosynthesis C-methylase UbiE